jgi:3-oxoacyl-[acyl-carrier protein] reductase
MSENTLPSVILVTGASSDIGLTLIRRLLALPERPTILAHSFRGAAKIEVLEAEFGDRIVPLQADFSSTESVLAMADKIASTHGTPMSIVHLPALRLVYERFTKLKWDQLEQDMNVQLRAAVLLLQRFLPKMSKLPNTRLVFVLSSVVHGMPPKFLSQYTVVKYAQLGLMRALATEYAATTLRVNAISPSMVQTQFLSDIAPLAAEMSAAANPLGRNATPDDVVGAILFLLGPGAAYITGTDLPITAGTVC